MTSEIDPNPKDDQGACYDVSPWPSVNILAYTAPSSLQTTAHLSTTFHYTILIQVQEPQRNAYHSLVKVVDKTTQMQSQSSRQVWYREMAEQRICRGGGCGNGGWET